jgi:hypothetical protein
MSSPHLYSNQRIEPAIYNKDNYNTILEEAEMAETVCESIDRLITVEMRRRGIPRGIITPLYNLARQKQGDRPLTYLAATALMKAAEKRTPMIVSTGFKFGDYVPLGETDGPPGAAALARSLHVCFGLPIIMLTESDLIDGTAKVVEAAGMNVRKGSADFSALTDVCILGFPTDEAEARKQAAKMIADIDPCAVITTEKVGRGEKGVYHSALGTDITEEQAKIDLLIEQAREKNILTIGIGDVGNEIGFGLILDEAKKIVPRGTDCGCDCHAGIITSTATDILIPCAVSNWGAYGIGAALAILNNNSEILHQPRDERRMILDCLNSGAIDGGTGRPTLGVDGIDMSIHENMVAMLSELVRIGQMEEFKRGF